MIQNPIFKGFNPDPCVCRKGDDYYAAVSSFEWFPGIPIYHSKDLKNWELYTHVLTDDKEVDLKKLPSAKGIWAPCLTYCKEEDLFYVVYGVMNSMNARYFDVDNFVITAKDIKGPWSKPVYLHSSGFDASMFHDDDGKKYVVSLEWETRAGYEKPGFISIVEYDPVKKEIVGYPRPMWRGGTDRGCIEAPHLTKRGGYYYIMCAEGGTGYNHCVTMGRSKNVWGPYERDPKNPIVTSSPNESNERHDPDHLKPKYFNPDSILQKSGHGSYVETQNGEWYMAHLCSRPNSARGSLLGRETALQKITWQDGWPRLACGGKIAQNAVPAPKDLPEVELPAMAEQDDFDVPALAPGYATPRTPLGDCVNLTVRPGWLRLTGQESMNSLHHVTLVARRQQEHEMQAETRMDFAPVCPEQMAGFTYCYDSMNFYLLGKTCAEDGTPVLELLKSDTGVVEDVCDPVPVPDGTLDFKLTTTPDGGMAQFYYRQPQGEWQSIGPACPTDILTDEHCRGFTGAHVGVYAHDMAGLHNHADFDYLNVHFER